MKRVVRVVMLLAAGLLLMLPTACDNLFGSDDDSEDDGTVTVSITGADSQNGENFGGAVCKHGDDLTQDNGLAYGGVEINGSGEATATLIELDDNGDPTGEEWEGSGGKKYDVYIWIDAGDSGPGARGDFLWEKWPYTYKQDGDELIETNFDDYDEVE